MSSYLVVILLVGIVVILCDIASFLVCYVFWTLAQDDMFFTVLKEGHTKAIMSNGKPVRLVMRAENHRFRNQLKNPGEGHPWDILPYPTPSVSEKPLSRMEIARKRFRKWLSFISGSYLFDNLVWVGFPPTYTVYTYKFHWTSRVQDPNGDGMVQKPREETISHILAPQQEVYFAKIEDAKTSELIPVNASVALTIQIVNPLKALFVQHQWLKAVINQLEPEIREVIGRCTFEALTKSSASASNEPRNLKPGESASNELEADPGLKERRKTIEKDYGVKIVLAQFRSIEQSGKPMDEITRLSLQEYTAAQKVKVAEQDVLVAEQKAKEIDILAEATERRLTKELGAVTKLGDGAVEIRRAELLPKGLLVLGGQAPVMPTIPLSRQSPEKNQGER
ncbi:MAG: hypothetical protein HYY92_00405 [Parcubacteria group bacterium]|nr:hypothetical protein [Parcubacteria group bacterium]